MNKLVSIVVTVNDGSRDHTFEVDTEKQCLLVWNPEGWDTLAEYYEAKGEPAKAQEVRDRKCPKAQPRMPADAAAPAGDAVVALKTRTCLPTEWP